QLSLCSPETAAAPAITGVITDPRDLGIPYPRFEPPTRDYVNTEMLVPPVDGHDVELLKGPNIVSLPEFDPLPERLRGPALLRLGDDISTDEIMPAGARVLPYRSNIPAMADFAFDIVDETYPSRAREVGDHFVVGGGHYGPGPSREHAAIVPRYLGLRAVLAKSIARIHGQNLLNFAVLPLTFVDPSDYDRIDQGDVLEIDDPAGQLRQGEPVEVTNETKRETYKMRHRLTPRQVDIVVRGSLLSAIRDRQPG